MCCGDNFYGCFPNLYAIRGGQYRDLAAWIHSIDVLMSYPAECLLPGHTAAILGHETISSTLGNFRNAFEYILTQTLEGMNAERLRISWRLIYNYPRICRSSLSGRALWLCGMDGTVHLLGLPGMVRREPHAFAPPVPRRTFTKMIALIGGMQTVLDAAKTALSHTKNTNGVWNYAIYFYPMEIQQRGSIAPKGFLAGKTGGVRNQRQRTALLYGMCQRNEPGINSNFF